MAKRKYTYGKGSSEWKNPGDYYINDKWKCYYTDTGSGQSGKFTVKMALRLSDEFKDNPDEVIRVMIAGDQAKRRRDAEAGEGPESKKGKRTAATEALTVAAAAGHMAESPKRAPAPVTLMNLSEGRNRDYDAERRSADERREHRRMAGSFGNIQKIVDEGGETQIAAGERRAKGLALRGKVRSSGRFGKHTPAAMYEHVHGPVQYHSSYSEEIPGGGKIPGKMGEQPGQGEERNARCYR